LYTILIIERGKNPSGFYKKIEDVKTKKKSKKSNERKGSFK